MRVVGKKRPVAIYELMCCADFGRERTGCAERPEILLQVERVTLSLFIAKLWIIAYAVDWSCANTAPIAAHHRPAWSPRQSNIRSASHLGRHRPLAVNAAQSSVRSLFSMRCCVSRDRGGVWWIGRRWPAAKRLVVPRRCFKRARTVPPILCRMPTLTPLDTS